MGRVEGQFGGVFRRCDCRKRKVPEKKCPHPWYYRVRHDGEMRKMSVAPGAEGKRLAFLKLREIQIRLAREKHLGIRTTGHATLAEFWPKVEAEMKPRRTPDTWRAFERRYGVAKAFFVEGMDGITPARVREFLRHLGTRREGRPVKAATRNRYLDTLSVALTFAVGEGYATENPVPGIRREREERRPPTRVSRADLEAIVARLPEGLRGLVRLVYDTGLRRAEAMALEWRDVDLGRRALVVRRAKSKRFRSVPLNSHALGVLRDLAPGRVAPLRGEDPVFRDLPHPDAVSKAVTAAAEAASLPGTRLHDLRAAFVTALLESGQGSSVVRDLAGHSSVAVTDRYAAGAPTGAMRDAVEGIEGPQERPQKARKRRAS